MSLQFHVLLLSMSMVMWHIRTQVEEQSLHVELCNTTSSLSAVSTVLYNTTCMVSWSLVWPETHINLNVGIYMLASQFWLLFTILVMPRHQLLLIKTQYSIVVVHAPTNIKQELSEWHEWGSTTGVLLKGKDCYFWMVKWRTAIDVGLFIQWTDSQLWNFLYVLKKESKQ